MGCYRHSLPCTFATLPDLCDCRCSYVVWIQASYPNGANPLLIDVLERCTRSIKDDAQLFARYRNDVEYVKIWIAYVSGIQTSV